MHRVVALRDVVVRVGGRRLLGPIDLQVLPGERWVLMGPNGSGKTTLLTVVGARRQPSEGTAEVLGVTFGRGDLRSLHPRIGHSGHTLTEMLPPSITVLEVVLTGSRSRLVTWFYPVDDAERDRAHLRLAEVGCDALADQRFGSCSQGERQRVLLARALYGERELLLLDEPSAGLDFPARERLIAALEVTARTTPSPVSLLATHHMEEVPPSTTHAALLRSGRLLASGPVEEILTPSLLGECFEVEVEVGRRDGRWWAASPQISPPGDPG